MGLFALFALSVCPSVVLAQTQTHCSWTQGSADAFAHPGQPVHRLSGWEGLVSLGCAVAFTITASGGILTQTGYIPANLEPDSFLQVRAVKLAPVPFEQKLPHWKAQGELQELQICCATVCLAIEIHALQF